VEFSILGPISARADGREVTLGGPKLRALLTILLLRANEVVPRDRLIEGLWGERVPASASHTLDDYVSRLRKALGAGRIQTQAPGYRLRVDPGELDLDRFEALLAEGRASLAAADPAGALATFDRALALWRGPALADVVLELVGERDAEGLEERRVLAIELRMDAALALGGDADLVAELETLVRAHPFRERLLHALMLALYRSGRQAEALEAYQAARRRYAEELGLEPGPLVRELEQQILLHDPGLALGRRPAPTRAHRRKVAAGLAGAAAAAMVAVAVVFAVIAIPGGGSRSPAASASPRLLGIGLGSGGSGRAVALRGAPAVLAGDGGSVWLADPDAGTVSRVDADAGREVQRVALGGNPAVMAVAGGSVWVAGVPGETVTRIDRETEAVTQTVRLSGASTSAIAADADADAVWVADAVGDRLVRIDPATGEIRGTVGLGLSPTALAVGAGGVWVADYGASSVAEVDAASGQTLVTVSPGKGPVAIAVGADGVWVANALDSTVSRIDPASGAVVATVPVPSGPIALAATGGSIWVASRYAGMVSEIDARTNTVVRRRDVGGSPTALSVAGDTLWVGMRPRVARSGGRLVLLSQEPVSVDPGRASHMSPFQSTGFVHDGLVAFNHASGPAGLQLVPDLAVALPAPTDGGRTYTFRLRPGIRYSDGRPVRAGDFRRGIERSFFLRSYDRDLFDAIIGAQVCIAPRVVPCHLPRGVASDERERTVTFSLTRPEPQFLTNLTNGGFAVPVPPGTPMGPASAPIRGSGPYEVAEFDHDHIRYVRNPYFREWSHAAQPDGQPDEIVWRFGLTPEQEVGEIEHGQADWTNDPVPSALLASLQARHPAQLHTYPTINTDFLEFNTRRAPFDDVHVRRAVNLAIDRRQLTALQPKGLAATPACQLLPPGVTGYQRYCPYRHDLARARRLVRAAGARGAPVTVWGMSDDPFFPPAMTYYEARVLRELGFRTTVRLATHPQLADPPARVWARFQIGPPTGWSDPNPYNFFEPWLSCHGAGDHGWFCDPLVDRALHRASSLEATSPPAAARLWSRIDHEITDRAVLVPFANEGTTTFVSRRVSNVQNNPYLGLIADQLRLQAGNPTR
jgi:ABC-type transport system substrate-binding protein/DNA-binding SARP family transcriptional activator